jgi:hypothetical protein
LPASVTPSPSYAPHPANGVCTGSFTIFGTNASTCVSTLFFALIAESNTMTVTWQLPGESMEKRWSGS